MQTISAKEAKYHFGKLIDTARAEPVTVEKHGRAVVVIVGVLLSLLYALPEVRRWLFAVVLIAAILIEMIFARPRRPGVKVRFYGIGFLIQAVAFMIWNVDQRSLVCAPNSLIQGHAVWHLLGATALWFTFLYYRSEGTGRRPMRQGSGINASQRLDLAAKSVVRGC